MKNNVKKFLSLIMALAIILTTAGTSFAFPKPPPVGSISIRPRVIEDENPTQDQALDQVKTPTLGTVGYTLYRVADYDHNTGEWTGVDGQAYTHLKVADDTKFNKDDPATYIEVIAEQKNDPDAGQIDFSKLKLGRYIAVQTTKSSGSKLGNDFMIDIPGFSKDPLTGKTNTEEYTYDVVVFPKNTIVLSDFTIKKVDGDADTAMNAWVSIEKTQGTLAETDTLTQVNGKWYVKANGQTIHQVTAQGLDVQGVEPGTYVVREHATDAGYTLNLDAIEIVVDNDGNVTMSSAAKDSSYAFVSSNGASSLTLKNYKAPTVEKVLADKENQIQGTGNAYFDASIRDFVKWNINVKIPANIRQYKNFVVTDTPQKEMKFKEFGQVSYNGQVLVDGTDYNVSGNALTLTVDGINKIADVAETLAQRADLVVEASASFDKDAFDWDVLEHTNTAKISYEVTMTPDTPPTTPEDPPTETPHEEEHTPKEKMVTGTLEIVKTLNGTTEGAGAPEDVEFKIYRKVNGSNTEEWLTFEQRADGTWFANGVANDEASATVLSPDAQVDANTSAPIKVYGLMISNTDTGLKNAQYFVKETKAPNGYKAIVKDLDGSISGPDNLRAKLTVENKVGPDLPITGGQGVALGLGLIALLGAGALYTERKKKQERA